ncbi:DUF2840 domain-containing protein [Algihabitans albus]|uniref:DUF2840 domain-containing protein n=1 Tax=Algihabitans albus TaxID=2164067 RepID=UPI000E5CE313|nr:DUF2840 domain-containing protein [Algihabitans albus]
MTGRTTVDLLWIEGRVERWIRFGRTMQETVHSRRRRTVGFNPGAVFAFVRWSANDYGTVESRLDILRAVRPDEGCSTVPHVTPGGEILLRLTGWPTVEAALIAIDQIEALGLAPEDVCPDHWRHVHNRLTTGLDARPYTDLRHTAWLKRSQVSA